MAKKERAKRGGRKARRPAAKSARAQRATSISAVETFDSDTVADLQLADEPAEAVADKRIILPEVCDAVCVSALRSDFLQRRGSELVVDASGVRRIGTLGLQVLLSAARTWSDDCNAFEVTNPTPEFIDAVNLLGLDHGELKLGSASV